MAIALLVGTLLLATWMLTQFVNNEKIRDLKDWEITLGVMADNRAVAIEQWLASQFTPLMELSDNGSLQLYISQLELGRKGQSSNPEPAQISYLRNLIKATAIRTGITALSSDQHAIPANLKLPSNSGLALVDTAGQILVATPSMPTLDNRAQQRILLAIKNGQRQIRDIHLNSRQQPVMGFIVPIPGLDGLSDQKRPAGAIVAVKAVSSELYPLLRSHTRSIKTDESYLIKKNANGIIEFVSPLADKTPALTKQLSSANSSSAAAIALAQPGSFSKGTDYQGNSVYFTSRAIKLAPWTVIQKMGSVEVSKETQDHRTRLIVFFVISIIAITGLLVAAWRHGVSIRERESAYNLQQSSQQLAKKNSLLSGITGNVTDYSWLLDESDRISFVNRPLTNKLGVDEQAIKGKTLSSVFGPHVGESITKITNHVRQSKQRHANELSLEINGEIRKFYTTAVAIPSESNETTSILVTLHDTTELRKSEEQRYRLSRQLIEALMQAIDLHDPFSANHSARVSEIALAIADELKLNPQDRSTLDTAASLCNIGKILIPKEVLTKTTPLTNEEMSILVSEMEYVRQILGKIDFPGDVLGTILQKNAHLDGSGQPKGIGSDEMQLAARILCTANAYVAMVSPRAYREKMDSQEALDALLKKDIWYDRTVLAALFHVMENKPPSKTR